MENLDTQKKTLVRLIILLMCAMIIPVSLMAQSDIHTGAREGCDVHNVYIEDAHIENTRTGFHPGSFAHFSIDHNFAIQPKILFNTREVNVSYTRSFFDGK